MPPRQAKQWTETEIDDLLDQKIGRLFDRLYEIEPGRDANDQPEPVVLGLSSSGKAAWIEFYNQHAQRLADATGTQAAALSKSGGSGGTVGTRPPLRPGGGRGQDRHLAAIDDQDISSGVALALWYADDAERTYRVLQETDDGKLRRQVVELVSRLGGRISGQRSPAAEQTLSQTVRTPSGSSTSWSRRGSGRGSRSRRRTTAVVLPVNSCSLTLSPYPKPQKTAKKRGFRRQRPGKAGSSAFREFDSVQRTGGRGSCIRNPSETREKRGFGYGYNGDSRERES